MPLIDKSTLAQRDELFEAQDLPLGPRFDEAIEEHRADLSAIAVSSELASLFHNAKDLLEDVISSETVPANQKAQVLNSVMGILERITKTRTDLYNSERLRNIEQVLIRLMKDQPAEVRERFVEQYKEALNA